MELSTSPVKGSLGGLSLFSLWRKLWRDTTRASQDPRETYERYGEGLYTSGKGFKLTECVLD